MATTRRDDEIRISPNPAVFDLPILVGIDEGLFEKHGVHLTYSAQYSDRQNNPNEPDVLKRLKESLFVEGKADAYNVCEWGGIDRIERGTEKAKIAALRPAVAHQAIISFDDKYQVPRDLADVEIGINDFTGSHYTTLQLLEGALGREHVKLVHVGEPGHRYEQAKTGKIAAVTVMEPFITLALKEGAHIIASTSYRGAEIINPDLPEAVRKGYFAAIDEAVGLIQKNFERYAHHITKVTKGRLAPSELGLQFIHYVQVERYAEQKFDAAYEWMKSRDFSHGRNQHNSLVIG
ncbi:MAG: ABC-type nitrate/sulfonate/bicarbonate transport system periplasmic component-like protein [Xanthobacteraceae bacterium]|nr:ABC-type nitrate/sulfonate/bicarbonate transport system periplasmic component-like protein [Xanthobacteraceae bacterium]